MMKLKKITYDSLDYPVRFEIWLRENKGWKVVNFIESNGNITMWCQKLSNVI